ncbi:MAG TPA: hypothetical protein VLA49_21725 [Anaerolineales bacterium]|nr:hypothetical protein [Anaerolineales bacterium]
MKTHVQLIGWLWIAWGIVSMVMVIVGLIIANVNIPNPQDSILVTSGVLCLFIPGTIADFAAGFGLLQYKSWARILAIILAIINLIFLCALILPAALAIYTLIIMFNGEAKALFNGQSATAAMEEVS